MDAKSSDRTFLCRQRGVDFLFLCRVEWDTSITDDDFQSIIVGNGVDIDCSLHPWWVCILHDVDNCLFNGEVQTHH